MRASGMDKTISFESEVLRDTPLEFESPESNLVAGATYTPGQDILKVRLWTKMGVNTNVYRYGSVPPQVWAGFVQADSKGSYFQRCIRPMFLGVKE